MSTPTRVVDNRVKSLVVIGRDLTRYARLDGTGRTAPHEMPKNLRFDTGLKCAC